MKKEDIEPTVGLSSFSEANGESVEHDEMVDDRGDVDECVERRQRDKETTCTEISLGSCTTNQLFAANVILMKKCDCDCNQCDCDCKM